MLNLNELDRVHLEFIGDNMTGNKNIVVTDVVFNTNGEPMWVEGYSINVVGKKPEPVTIFPWSSIKLMRPL